MGAPDELAATIVASPFPPLHWPPVHLPSVPQRSVPCGLKPSSQVPAACSMSSPGSSSQGLLTPTCRHSKLSKAWLGRHVMDPVLSPSFVAVLVKPLSHYTSHVPSVDA